MKRSLGFTLIEMAIVMVILGLVTAAAVQVIKPLKDVTKTDLTLQHLAIIQKALQLYVMQNGCLPCPTRGDLASTSGDAGYALASDGTTHISGCAGTGVTCYASNRVVPWIALGISEDEASDGWGDRIRYVVTGTPCSGITGDLTSTNGMLRCATSGSSAFPTGGVTVTDNDAGTTSAAAYVLISSGADRAMGLAAYTGTSTGTTYTSGSQYTNANGTTTFYKGTRNDTSGTSYFDDLVVFKTPSILILTCGSDACGNPA